MRLLESGEMYLETIHILSLKGGHVRSLDVAEYMGFSKPSVSRAVGLLKGGGYITVDEDGYLTLTDVGREVASKIYEQTSSPPWASIPKPRRTMPVRSNMTSATPPSTPSNS